MRSEKSLSTYIYLLYLVGITLFTDMSATYIDVSYMGYFKDLELFKLLFKLLGGSRAPQKLQKHFSWFLTLNLLGRNSRSMLFGWLT